MATRRLIAVAVAAALTVLAIDIVIGALVPPVPREYETVDALSDYQNSNPDVVVLGSSFVRPFIPLAEWYRKQPVGLEMAIIPIEGGKLYAYDWLLQQRFGRLIDEKKPDGTKVRDRLSHMILVINYHDACTAEGELYANLPARAWALKDYVSDFVSQGATAYNANYVDQKWRELTGWSSLMSDRGFFRIIPRLRDKTGIPDNVLQSRKDAHLAGWIEMVSSSEIGKPACRIEEQTAAFDRILDFARDRQIEVSVVLWPTIPMAQTPSVLKVTNLFKDYVISRVQPRGIAVFDLQSDNVLLDSDFRPDLDHLIPVGEQKVVRWALQGPYKELEQKVAQRRSVLSAKSSQ